MYQVPGWMGAAVSCFVSDNCIDMIRNKLMNRSARQQGPAAQNQQSDPVI